MSRLAKIGRSICSLGVAKPSTAVLERLTAVVTEVERGHSGEVRLVIEKSLPLELAIQDITPRTRALWHFAHEKVWDTEANSGVLVYLLLSERSLEIVADRGINERVDSSLWSDIAERTVKLLSEDAKQFEAALGYCLAEIGKLLRIHFPLDAEDSDLNELTNEPRLV